MPPLAETLQLVRKFPLMPRSAPQSNISVWVSELLTQAFHFHKGDSLLTGQDHHGNHNWSRSRFKLYNMTTSSPISSLVKWCHHSTKSTFYIYSKCKKQWREHTPLKTESLFFLNYYYYYGCLQDDVSYFAFIFLSVMIYSIRHNKC